MTAHPKIYVAGHRGMVGSAIVRHLLANGQPVERIVTRTHAELDLTNQAAVSAFFATEKPDQVYLAAAKVGGIHANNTYPPHSNSGCRDSGHAPAQALGHAARSVSWHQRSEDARVHEPAGPGRSNCGAQAISFSCYWTNQCRFCLIVNSNVTVHATPPCQAIPTVAINA